MSEKWRDDLSEMVVVVTGAGRGIGREMARTLTGAGARVALLDINQSNLERAVAEIAASGGDAKGYRVDLGSQDEIISTLASVEESYGRVDTLINNAIAIGTEELLKTSLEDWELSMRVTLTAGFLCIKQLLPGMIGRGSGNIINIGTVNAKTMLGSDAYSVAKAGLHALTRSVAVRYGPDGIRCNTVVPGSVATEVWEERAARNPKIFEDLKPWYPLGRVGKPADIAQAVLFLASSRSEWMTGTEMVVDGGLLAGPAPMFRIIEASDGTDE